MEETLFTKIVNKEIPSIKIYEDNDTYAFLDINPNSKGHSLVILKESYKNIYEIPDERLCILMTIVKKISIAIKNALGADGINIIMNNEKDAGQEIMHAHIHIIPRFKSKDFVHGKHIKYNVGEIEEIGEKIRKFI